MTMVGFFRGIGDTRTPLVVVLMVELLSVILAVLLIFGVAGCPRLGIAGAALSTVICRTVGTVIYLGLFLRRGRREVLVQPRLPFDRHACWYLIRVSWPIGAQGSLEMSAWTLFTAFIARLGTADAAAHAIAMRVTPYPTWPAMVSVSPRRLSSGSTWEHTPCRRTAQYGVVPGPGDRTDGQPGAWIFRWALSPRALIYAR